MEQPTTTQQQQLYIDIEKTKENKEILKKHLFFILTNGGTRNTVNFIKDFIMKQQNNDLQTAINALDGLLSMNNPIVKKITIESIQTFLDKGVDDVNFENQFLVEFINELDYVNKNSPQQLQK